MGTEATHFLFWEYINGIFVAVYILVSRVLLCKGYLNVCQRILGVLSFRTDHILHVVCTVIYFRKVNLLFSLYILFLLFIMVFLYEEVYAKSLELLVSAWLTKIL
jgi:hypothetical protein